MRHTPRFYTAKIRNHSYYQESIEKTHSGCCGGKNHSEKKEKSGCCGGKHHSESSSTQYLVDGMACEGCAETVEKTALALAGVTAANVDFDTKKLSISGSFDSKELESVMKEAGYTLQAI